jgi:mono/diheme cytochrome c family protein
VFRWLFLLLITAGCSGEVALEEQGRRVYVANCTACHHVDPTRDGTLGPAVAGSSRELIESRVLGAKYPDGYRPKRDTALMQPLPYLKNEIAALAAYLAKP